VEVQKDKLTDEKKWEAVISNFQTNELVVTMPLRQKFLEMVKICNNSPVTEMVIPATKAIIPAKEIIIPATKITIPDAIILEVVDFIKLQAGDKAISDYVELKRVLEALNASQVLLLSAIENVSKCQQEANIALVSVSIKEMELAKAIILRDSYNNKFDVVVRASTMFHFEKARAYNNVFKISEALLILQEFLSEKVSVFNKASDILNSASEKNAIKNGLVIEALKDLDHSVKKTFNAELVDSTFVSEVDMALKIDFSFGYNLIKDMETNLKFMVITKSVCSEGVKILESGVLEGIEDKICLINRISILDESIEKESKLICAVKNEFIVNCLRKSSNPVVNFPFLVGREDNLDLNCIERSNFLLDKLEKIKIFRNVALLNDVVIIKKNEILAICDELLALKYVTDSVLNVKISIPGYSNEIASKMELIISRANDNNLISDKEVDRARRKIIQAYKASTLFSDSQNETHVIEDLWLNHKSTCDKNTHLNSLIDSFNSTKDKIKFKENNAIEYIYDEYKAKCLWLNKDFVSKLNFCQNDFDKNLAYDNIQEQKKFFYDVFLIDKQNIINNSNVSLNEVKLVYNSELATITSNYNAAISSTFSAIIDDLRAALGIIEEFLNKLDNAGSLRDFRLYSEYNELSDIIQCIDKLEPSNNEEVKAVEELFNLAFNLMQKETEVCYK
jgi:uncharacterized protein YdcH (DUF465 family)